MTTRTTGIANSARVKIDRHDPLDPAKRQEPPADRRRSPVRSCRQGSAEAETRSGLLCRASASSSASAMSAFGGSSVFVRQQVVATCRRYRSAGSAPPRSARGPARSPGSGWQPEPGKPAQPAWSPPGASRIWQKKAGRRDRSSRSKCGRRCQPPHNCRAVRRNAGSSIEARSSRPPLVPDAAGLPQRQRVALDQLADRRDHRLDEMVARSEPVRAGEKITVGGRACSRYGRSRRAPSMPRGGAGRTSDPADRGGGIERPCQRGIGRPDRRPPRSPRGPR